MFTRPAERVMRPKRTVSPAPIACAPKMRMPAPNPAIATISTSSAVVAPVIAASESTPTMPMTIVSTMPRS